MASKRILIVGASLRGMVLLERIAASLDELRPDDTLAVDVVDDWAPGSGRIWRDGQPHELVMNTVAAQSTVFTDETVDCAGPVVPGPTFFEWCRDIAAGVLTEPTLLSEAARTLPWSNPSRLLYGHYLRWAWDRLVETLPAQLELVVHRDRVIRLEPSGEGYRAHLRDGAPLEVDVVALALGWLPAEPGPERSALQRAAAAATVTVIEPGNPIDQGLDVIEPGQTVVVRGLGMNFFDAVSLLTENRGGTFDHGTYTPSGREPRIIAGSRRGIPFQAKPAFGALPPSPAQRHLRGALPRLVERRGVLNFEREVRPLIDADATHDYYEALARVRPNSVVGPIETLLDAIGTQRWQSVLEHAVPDAADRLDLHAIENPPLGPWVDADEADAAITELVRLDVLEARRGFDSPLKLAMWSIGAARGAVIPLVEFGGLPATSLPAYQRFGEFATFLQSGPPLFRSEQLLALHEGGIVRFTGPGLQVALRGREFEASTDLVPGAATASALVEAWLDTPTLAKTADPLLRGLHRDGLVKTHRSDELDTGGLDIDPDTNAVLRPDGTASPRLFSVGLPSEDARTFTIIAPVPHANSAVLRELDAAARSILVSLERTP